MVSYEHKVKNIYLGAREQTIEVDWTTLSALPTWWATIQWTPRFSWWLYNQNSGESNSVAVWYPLDMRTVKKITIECNWTKTNTSSSRPGRDEFWITDNTSRADKLAIAKSLVHVFWYKSNNTFGSNGVWLKLFNTTSSVTDLNAFSTWANVWDWNTKTEINLDTWYCEISSTAPYTYNRNYTLNTTLLNTVKDFSYVLIGLYSANSSRSTVYQTTITIER